MESILSPILAIAMLVFVVWLYFILPWQMAERRRRNPWIWLGISLVGSPLLAILLLLALGDAPNVI